MSEKPFKFRRVHEIAGVFVLILVLLAAALVMVTGRLQGWFEKKSTYELVLPRDGVEGIRAGSEVRILGTRVGRVRSVELRQQGSGKRLGKVWEVDPDQIQLVAVLEVRGDRNVFVGAESEGVVRKDLGGFGASFVEITRGSQRRAEGESSLPLRLEEDMTNELTTAVRELQEVMLPAIEQVNLAYGEVETLASSMVDPESDFQKALVGLNQIIGDLNEGEGALGVMLKDEQAAADLAETVSGMNDAVGTLASVLEEFEEGKGAAGLLFRDEEVQEQVASSVASTDEVLSQLPETVRATNQSLDELNQTTEVLRGGLKEFEYVAEALQRHWMLRRFVVRDEDAAQSRGTGSRKGLLKSRSQGEGRTESSAFASGRRPRGTSGAGRR